MAEVLVRFGATPVAYVPPDEEVFAATCFRLDRDDASDRLAAHPEYLRSTSVIFTAAKRDRADVVALLLDLGMSIEIEDKAKQRPLHVAAGSGSLAVAALLVARGAEVDPVESNWNNTPLDAALYYGQTRMVEFLSGVSRDIYLVAFAGHLERVRELLRAEPDLAKSSKHGNTLLMWLPDDEARAIEDREAAHRSRSRSVDPQPRRSRAGGLRPRTRALRSRRAAGGVILRQLGSIVICRVARDGDASSDGAQW